MTKIEWGSQVFTMELPGSGFGGCAARKGKSNQNKAPPCSGLIKPMRPPSKLIKRSLMDKPKPAPPYMRCTPSLAKAKRLKMAWLIEGSMPIPVS